MGIKQLADTTVTLIDRVNDVIGRLVRWLVLAMIAIGVWNVIARDMVPWLDQKFSFSPEFSNGLANLSSNAFIEAQWYLFDLLFLLGVAYVIQSDRHVRVDLLYKDYTPKRKALINLLGTIFFLIPFDLVIMYYSWGFVMRSWRDQEVSPNPGGLAVYPIKTMIVVGFTLLLLQAISEIIKNVQRLQGSRS
jgi:TRAP-type mannitol/chloroaromatic compound transport system permease small subunit